MEKVILSNGQEFDLVSNGVITDNNSVTFTFIPGAATVEQLMEMWAGNQTITVKNADVSVEVFDNYTKCSRVTLIPDYLIDTKPVCPECKVDVPLESTACPSCKVEYAAPEMAEVRGKVCTVVVIVPDINDRMNAAEGAIDTLVASALRMK